MAYKTAGSAANFKLSDKLKLVNISFLPFGVSIKMTTIEISIFTNSVTITKDDFRISRSEKLKYYVVSDRVFRKKN